MFVPYHTENKRKASESARDNNDRTEIIMANNPRNKENLRPFSKGESGNPAGRPPRLANTIKAIPKEAQGEIYAVLHHALSLTSEQEARAYLNEQAEGMKYGFVLQVAIKSLTGPQAWAALSDILDRLFGKPRMSMESTISLNDAESSRPEIVIM